MKCFLPFVIFLIQACSTSQSIGDGFNHLTIENYVLPEIEFQRLSKAKSISRMDIENLLKRNAIEDGEIDESFSPPDSEERRFFCGLIVESEAERLYREGSKFRVVGVTEKWIPIEGKVSKVLHLKLAP